jgi:hypothetical protein
MIFVCIFARFIAKWTSLTASPKSLKYARIWTPFPINIFYFCFSNLSENRVFNLFNIIKVDFAWEEGSGPLMTEVCNYLIQSDNHYSFQGSTEKHKYKNYKTIYPEWEISPTV